MNDFMVPAFCPVCERVMKGSMSTKTFYDLGCCRDCFIAFVEHKEEKWSSGWRPSEEQIRKYYSNL